MVLDLFRLEIEVSAGVDQEHAENRIASELVDGGDAGGRSYRILIHDDFLSGGKSSSTLTQAKSRKAIMGVVRVVNRFARREE